MRSLWLASAAIILSAGVACAQTSSPAPTGNPATPVTPTQPGMSPGNEGSSGTSMSPNAPGSMSSGTGATGTMPAATGAPNAAVVTKSKMSPGNTTPAPTTGGKMKHKHMASGTAKGMAAGPPVYAKNKMGTSEHGSPSDYLKAAKIDIMHHNKAAADDALGYAETRLLNRLEIGGMAPHSPSLTAVMDARKAVAAGNFAKASSDVDMVMAMEPDAVPTKGGATHKMTKKPAT